MSPQLQFLRRPPTPAKKVLFQFLSLNGSTTGNTKESGIHSILQSPPNITMAALPRQTRNVIITLFMQGPCGGSQPLIVQQSKMGLLPTGPGPEPAPW
jgi:hypothetical protein